MDCRFCGSANPTDSRSCGRCGAPLAASPGRPALNTLTVPLAAVLAPGSLIVGKYRVAEELGRGGMGVVYKAEDLTLKRTVAVKFLSAELLGDAEHRARFIREAQMASALNDPRICTIYEVGDDAGAPYIAMEHIAGRALSDSSWPDAERAAAAVRLGSQIAGALEHAHGQGILHRDLKASNVMLTPEGRVKILDFGLAKRSAPLDREGAGSSREGITRTGSFLGTIQYAAPEVLRGEPASVRSDIWALGVLLYELAAGSLPFGGRTGFELTSAILRDKPAPLPPRISSGLGAIIMRCLEKAPDERFQKAKEVQVALDTLSGARPEAGTAASPSGSRRRTKWALIIGAAAVVLLAAVWLAAVRGGRPPAGVGKPGLLSTGAAPSPVAGANEYFEKGMLFLLHQFDLPRARAMLARALEFDPKFAEARAWYGFSFVLEIDAGFSNDSGYLYRAEEELRRALGDDPDCARVHSGLAALYVYQGRNELSVSEAEKALAIDPKDLDARTWLGNFLILKGEAAEAKALWMQLLREDPLFFPPRMNLGEALRTEGDCAGAVKEHEKILEQDPQNLFATFKMARALMDMNDLGQARLRLSGLRETGRRNFDMDMTWALLLALEGKTEEARKKMDAECLKYAALSVFATLTPAEYYAVTGETTLALDWLEKAVRNGDERDDWFRRDPLLAPLRGLPRFRQILESLANRRQSRSVPKDD